jgi:hypothetical protein
LHWFSAGFPLDVSTQLVAHARAVVKHEADGVQDESIGGDESVGGVDRSGGTSLSKREPPS